MGLTKAIFNLLTKLACHQRRSNKNRVSNKINEKTHQDKLTGDQNVVGEDSLPPTDAGEAASSVLDPTDGTAAQTTLRTGTTLPVLLVHCACAKRVINHRG